MGIVLVAKQLTTSHEKLNSAKMTSGNIKALATPNKKPDLATQHLNQMAET